MPKNVRHRVVALLTGVVLATSLSACAPSDAAPEDDRPLVLATFTVIADMARNVAGDHVRVESITKVGAEIHGYSPTPGDIRRASGAQLILDNGLGLGAWFAQFTDRIDAPHVTVTEGIEPIDIASDAYAGAPNPHAWMSPVAAETYVANIAAALTELVPEHAGDFAANSARYTAELRTLHDELVSALDGLPANQRALVTCEGAFSYLARDAGLEELYLWPVNAESQATPQRVARVIDAVDEHDVRAVFCESTVSDRAMRQVVEATDAEFGGVLYVDSLSEPDGPVPTYLDLIRHDVSLIAGALATSRS
ncbi:metal ABC transporter substrate-binding protein [Salinibacterium sp. ZJ70]|uniref:metal ABC transporter substrate-binding protein n=1 Tax=Salinibacterium sp. ZJ70 TaxID=2708084 RepID=UPI00141D8A5D|nr:metal ABC transporter substrate-binding protein [Salinibacterium sp. ZJ70]